MFVHLSFRISKVLSLICTALVIMLGVSACDQQSSTTMTGNEIKIGYSASVTGDFAADGKALKQGYQLWADYVNNNGGILGRPVKLDVMEDNSTGDQVSKNYQQMIAVNHDDLVIGPYSTLLTYAAAPVAQSHGYALVEGIGGGKKVFDANFGNVFDVSLPVENYLTSFGFYVLSLPQAQRPKTVAYVSAEDPFAQPPVDLVKKALEQGSVTTSFYTTYNADTTKDFGPIAREIIATRPDVVILGTTGQSDSVGLINALKAQHFNPQAIIATAGPDQGAQFSTPLGGPSQAEGIFVPNGGWFPGIKTYQNDIFTQAYLTQYGGAADAISADTVEAFSVGQVLQQAIAKTQSLDNAALVKELNSGDTFNSLQGPVQFQSQSKGANVVASPYLFQWQSGKLVPVYPTNAAQANAEFPKIKWG